MFRVENTNITILTQDANKEWHALKCGKAKALSLGLAITIGSHILTVKEFLEPQPYQAEMPSTGIALTSLEGGDGCYANTMRQTVTEPD